MPRWLPAEAIHSQLMTEYQPRWEELAQDMLVSDAGAVRGVAIYWIWRKGINDK